MNVLLWAPDVSRLPVEAALRELPGLALTSVASTEDMAAALPQAEALVMPVSQYTPLLARQLHESASRLRWIQLMSIGFDRLVRDPPPAGVMVSNAGASLAPIVAEHTLALLLALGRRLGEAASLASRAVWDESHGARSESLSGKHALIFGFGAIGRETARRLRPFGVRITGVSRSAPPDPLADDVRPASSLDALLPQVDIVIVSSPLTAETRGLFDAKRLARMKRGAWLVNIARGPIVDTQALIDALGRGHLGGAALDAVDPEPLPPSHALWQAPNLVITPHVATAGGFAAVGAHIAAEVRRVLAGEQPASRVSLG